MLRDLLQMVFVDKLCIHQTDGRMPKTLHCFQSLFAVLKSTGMTLHALFITLVSYTLGCMENPKLQRPLRAYPWVTCYSRAHIEMYPVFLAGIRAAVAFIAPLCLACRHGQ